MGKKIGDEIIEEKPDRVQQKLLGFASGQKKEKDTVKVFLLLSMARMELLSWRNP